MSADTQLMPGHSTHVARFYGSDNELSASVASHLAEGLSRGEVGILIATGPHTHDFLEALGREGIDVEAAQEDGSLMTLDAAATLSKVMVDDSPSPQAFERMVGRMIRGIAAEGRRAYAYGELVSVLWDEGNVTAAIELEVLWNELLEDVGFSLLCGYPRWIIAPEQEESFEAVCRLHSEVIGGHAGINANGAGHHALYAEREFPLDKKSPSAARRFTAETLERWDHHDLIADALIVVTELATNAVIHARSEFTVSIEKGPGMVRITVGDASEAIPAISEDSTTGGHGLRLVDALTSRWGAAQNGRSKVVWAEFESVR